MSKNNVLAAQLQKLRGKPSRRDEKSTPLSEKKSRPPAGKPKARNPAKKVNAQLAPVSRDTETLTKTSVTLRSTDHQAIQMLTRFFEDNGSGRTPTLTVVVQILLRLHQAWTSEHSQELLAMLEIVKSEDKRRTPRLRK